MKKTSIKMIALHLERREAAACRAFARASEQAEARIIAAVEAVRPFREKLKQVKLERAAFATGQVVSVVEVGVPDPEPEQLSANLSLSALARPLKTQPPAAPKKHPIGVRPRQAST